MNWFLPTFEEDDIAVSVRSAAVEPRATTRRHAERGSAAGDRVPGEVQRSNTRGVPALRQVLLPMGSRPRPRGPRRNQGSHRDLPLHDGTTRPLRRRRSVGACRLCAATSASPTSTGGSSPIRPSTCAAPRCNPPNDNGWTAVSSAGSCSPPSTSTATMPRSPCCLASTDCACPRRCATDVDDLGFERGHRTLRILGKGNKPAMIPLVPRTAPSSWPHSTPACRSATSNSLPAMPTPAPQLSTTVDVRTSTATPPTSSLPSSPAADQHDADRHIWDDHQATPPRKVARRRCRDGTATLKAPLAVARWRRSVRRGQLQLPGRRSWRDSRLDRVDASAVVVGAAEPA